jgi:methyl-accepting chemotaxis protein
MAQRTHKKSSRKRVNMAQWSIVTKVTVLVCGIVTLLVVLGGAMLMKTELGMIRTFMEKHQEKIDHSLDARQQSEQENLQEFIGFIGEILNQAGSELLFKHKRDELIEVITPYLRHVAIGGIQIVEADETPFVAMWKMDDFMIHGEELPDTFLEDDPMKESIDMFYDEWEVMTKDPERRIGRLDIYFSNALLETKIDALKEEARQETEQFIRESDEYLERVMVSQGIGIAGIVLVLVLCLLLFLRIWVQKPLLVMADTASKLGEFDLTLDIRTTRKDEIGKLLTAISNTVKSFRTLLGQVQQSGIQVTSSAAELSATARQQEAVMKTQVESTNSVLDSIREISDLTENLARTMQQVALRFQETAEFASSGQTDLTHMEDAMTQMETASMSISNRLQAINEKAENITNVVTTITKVADQTNLLSLNAAIEAEKAGEYGRGFTVVAREIRRLADQTAVATLDIEQMVQEMQSAVSAGVMEMDKFIAEVRHSAEDVEGISLQLSRIIDQVQALSPSFDEVNVGMEHQAHNAQQIEEAMTHLSGEMHETKESLHETFSVIEQLNESSRTLQTEVSRFNVI